MIKQLTVRQYVQKHIVRGACTCGRCIDHPEYSEPVKGHTVNLTFFKVAQKGGNRRKFLKLVRAEYPHWLDGSEHSYIHVGAEVGDQGLALLIIGFGHLLRAWDALSPDTMMPYMDEETKLLMAGGGMVGLMCNVENKA